MPQATWKFLTVVTYVTANHFQLSGVGPDHGKPLMFNAPQLLDLITRNCYI